MPRPPLVGRFTTDLFGQAIDTSAERSGGTDSVEFCELCPTCHSAPPTPSTEFSSNSINDHVTEDTVWAEPRSKGTTVPPQKFEIVVKGRLSPTLLLAIDGFEVMHCTDGLTHLVGFVTDQAALHTLFEFLRDLNIELVSVNPVTEVVRD
jgi:hypothetical protein